MTRDHAMFPDHREAPRHTDEACARLLDRFLLPPAQLRAILSPHGLGNLPERDAVDLVGRVLWDVFSNNHAVFDERGWFHLGSFRAAAGFLAEEINVRYRQPGRRRDYMDFYMGTMTSTDRTTPAALYRWVFGGLFAASCDWHYAFPRLHLVSLEWQPDPNLAQYDPSAAVATERGPPPTIVQAYREVAGRWPDGWPPTRTDE